MLKKSASIVLASLEAQRTEACGLASLPAAVLLDGHFEHPSTIVTLAPSVRFHWRFMYKPSFPQPASPVNFCRTQRTTICAYRFTRFPTPQYLVGSPDTPSRGRVPRLLA